MTENSVPVAAAADALAKLRVVRPELADALARMAGAVAEEATRSPQFASALVGALASTVGAVSVPSDGAPAPAKRSRRRAPGVFDPFTTYREQGEGGLRVKLGELDVNQLKDIVAEHGMDHDRLAMRWKTPTKLIDRVVEKVAASESKGSAFRQ